MITEDLKDCLSQMFPSSKLALGNQYVEMTVEADNLFETSKILFQATELSFDYMICLTGVDYPEYIQVVYHLESTKHRHVVVLKVNTHDRQNANLDSLSEIWHTAKYHEREVYDLLGVKFNNHIDLRRLFLDDTWGHPLRKDYIDEVRIIKR